MTVLSWTEFLRKQFEKDSTDTVLAHTLLYLLCCLHRKSFESVHNLTQTNGVPVGKVSCSFKASLGYKPWFPAPPGSMCQSKNTKFTIAMQGKFDKSSVCVSENWWMKVFVFIVCNISALILNIRHFILARIHIRSVLTAIYIICINQTVCQQHAEILKMCSHAINTDHQFIRLISQMTSLYYYT